LSVAAIAPSLSQGPANAIDNVAQGASGRPARCGHIVDVAVLDLELLARHKDERCDELVRLEGLDHVHGAHTVVELHHCALDLDLLVHRQEEELLNEAVHGGIVCADDRGRDKLACRLALLVDASHGLVDEAHGHTGRLGDLGKRASGDSTVHSCGHKGEAAVVALVQALALFQDALDHGDHVVGQVERGSPRVQDVAVQVRGRSGRGLDREGRLVVGKRVHIVGEERDPLGCHEATLCACEIALDLAKVGASAISAALHLD